MSSGAPILPNAKPDPKSAAPSVIEKTPTTSPKTLTDYINLFVYVIMVGAAIYFGWKVGKQYALQFWMIVQMIGQVLREYIAKAIASLRAARDARQATARLSR